MKMKLVSLTTILAAGCALTIAANAATINTTILPVTSTATTAKAANNDATPTFELADHSHMPVGVVHNASGYKIVMVKDSKRAELTAALTKAGIPYKLDIVTINGVTGTLHPMAHSKDDFHIVFANLTPEQAKAAAEAFNKAGYNLITAADFLS